MTLDFAYTLYLMLYNNPDIDKNNLKHYVTKWFVLSVLTGRYVGSPESAMDYDIRRIEEKGFVEFLEEVEAAQLSETFWKVRLVQDLETTSTNSPAFNVFMAAQVYGSDNSLLMNGLKVEHLITTMGDIHHIFPKNYLQSNGLNDKIRYNQIANYTYLDTGTNIAIGDKSPNTYFPEVLAQCENKVAKYGNITDLAVLHDNLKTNCIPETIFTMTVEQYDEFLLARRRLMAEKIKNYYYSL